jgi:hypothetical protein
MPARHLRHQIGGRGRHDDEIGGAAQFDMAHLRLVGQVEEIAVDLLARQRRYGQRRHEFLRRAGQDRHDAAPAARAACGSGRATCRPRYRR